MNGTFFHCISIIFRSSVGQLCNSTLSQADNTENLINVTVSSYNEQYECLVHLHCQFEHQLLRKHYYCRWEKLVRNISRLVNWKNEINKTYVSSMLICISVSLKQSAIHPSDDGSKYSLLLSAGPSSNIGNYYLDKTDQITLCIQLNKKLAGNKPANPATHSDISEITSSSESCVSWTLNNSSEK